MTALPQELSKTRCLYRFLRLVLAAVSGILLSLSHTPAALWGMVWIALVPLFIAVYFSRKYESFLLGFVSFAIFYSLTFQWVEAFHPFALPFVTMVFSITFGAVPFYIFRSLVKSRGKLEIFLIPSIWVLSEYIKQNWFLSYPFGILGYTQFSWLALIQAADITGVLGISWLIIFVNVLISGSLLNLSGIYGKINRYMLIFNGVLLVLSFTVPLVYGAARLKTLAPVSEQYLKVGYAQTLFHPKRSWVENEEEYFRVISSQIDALSGLGCELIIFPELTVERFLSLNPELKLKNNIFILNGLSSKASEKNIAILFGSLEKTENKQYNSAFLFSGNGDLSYVYRKQKLVPFGEYNPFREFIPAISDYMKKTTDAIDLTAGNEFTVMKVDGGKRVLDFGVMICFESGFGQFGRNYAGEDIDFLVNMTNDYWSLSSVAMKQHLVFSIFRAIETRKPVLRISNGGYSGYITEKGKFYTKLPIFSQGLMTASLRLPEKSRTTIYTKFGDWFPLVCFVFIFSCYGFFIANRLQKKNRTKR